MASKPFMIVLEQELSPLQEISQACFLQLIVVLVRTLSPVALINATSFISALGQELDV